MKLQMCVVSFYNVITLKKKSEFDCGIICVFLTPNDPNAFN